MKEFTQNSLYPKGNCWQTAVACVLEVDPDTMPSQVDSYYEDKRDDGSVVLRMSYNNPLQAYLKKHHGLAYVEFHYPEEAFANIRVRGYHIMTGETVRSADYNGMRHVVVGKDGQVVWDPHPSRAGLIGDIKFAVLCSFPKAWEKSWSEERCVCPACKS
jgi:hypothetical protein